VRWTISDLIELGRTEAVPHLRAARETAPDERTLRYINKAIELLKDPTRCKVYSKRRTPRGGWSCVYSCAGRARSREQFFEDTCPRTLPNPGR
jgi:hypothetical protein